MCPVPQDKFSLEFLLKNVLSANIETIENNVRFMCSRDPITINFGFVKSTSSTSMLDFFPGLECWMFTELFSVAGKQLIHSIASKFSEDPYEFRRGWPDITMWKGSDLRFVEVKTAKDKVRPSQKKIIQEFVNPLGLDFCLVGAVEEN